MRVLLLVLLALPLLGQTVPYAGADWPYRVQGRYMVVDRLFERAELRLGAGNSAKQVRIERERARRRSRS